MASKQKRRVNSRADIVNHGYIYDYDGSAVRKIEVIPGESKQVRKKVHNKKRKSGAMTAVFVGFIAVASVVVMLMCIRFLMLKSDVTKQAKTIAAIETEIRQIRADNDTYNNSVLSEVNPEEVKKKADELGMDYPTEHQIKEFTTSGNSYVRQHRSVPDLE